MEKNEKTCKLMIEGSKLLSFIIALYVYFNYLKSMDNHVVLSPSNEFMSFKYFSIIFIVYFVTFFYTMKTVKSSENKKLWKAYIKSLLIGTIGVDLVLWILTFFAPLLKIPVIGISALVVFIYFVVKNEKNKKYINDYQDKLKTHVRVSEYINSNNYSNNVNSLDDEILYSGLYSKKLKTFVAVPYRYAGAHCKYYTNCDVNIKKTNNYYVNEIIELGKLDEIYNRSGAYCRRAYKNVRSVPYEFYKFKNAEATSRANALKFLQYCCQRKYGMLSMMVTDSKNEKCFVLIFGEISKFGKEYINNDYKVNMEKLNPSLEDYVDFFDNKIYFLHQKNIVYNSIKWDLDEK